LSEIQESAITCLTPEQIDMLEGQQMSLDFDLSKIEDDVTINLQDLDSVMINGTGAAPVLTIGDANSWIGQNSWNLSSDTITAPSPKIQLNGDDADIEINGESVVGMLREIRDRLNIIQVSETMEAEWDELRALREQYEAKLAECREKSRAWDALKQMPPPQVP